MIIPRRRVCETSLTSSFCSKSRTPVGRPWHAREKATNFGGTNDQLFLRIFDEIFIKDASLLFLYNDAKKSKMTKNSNQGSHTAIISLSLLPSLSLSLSLSPSLSLSLSLSLFSLSLSLSLSFSLFLSLSLCFSEKVSVSLSLSIYLSIQWRSKYPFWGGFRERSEPNPAGGLGGRCKPPSGVWGSAPEAFENYAFFFPSFDHFHIRSLNFQLGLNCGVFQGQGFVDHKTRCPSRCQSALSRPLLAVLQYGVHLVNKVWLFRLSKRQKKHPFCHCIFVDPLFLMPCMRKCSCAENKRTKPRCSAQLYQKLI